VVPDWIWYVFTFTFGCCIGSFLNVVIFRLPRDKSLVKPPSACPSCGKHIRFYDNIPLVSWLVLGRKCRFCKAPISPRYFVIELLSGSVFTGLFILYFRSNLRAGIGAFGAGGWFIYLLHLVLLAALLAVSAIDLQFWLIPVSVCWFVTAVGLLSSAVGVYIIEPAVIRGFRLLPSGSAVSGSLAVGAAAGLGLSCLLLATGLLKRSYESEEQLGEPSSQEQNQQQITGEESKINHYLQMYREIAFLLPIVICSLAVWLLSSKIAPVRIWWLAFSQQPVIAGLLGSLFGYFVGCGVVWATRIFGTLAFGKEAMGLGDVHLMGAAGAVIGAWLVVVAFFIAPFFGLAWAAVQMLVKKTRQIPYAPFLSLGILVAMILHDRIFSYLIFIFYH
jgi:leader peptidase (prepilin peptidase)/N-methyltransferase